MKLKLKKKVRTIKGKNYVSVDEKYDKSMEKKDMRGMKTAGIANELKLSEKQMGYSKMPKVKPQKKRSKP